MITNRHDETQRLYCCNWNIKEVRKKSEIFPVQCTFIVKVLSVYRISISIDAHEDRREIKTK